MVDDHFAPDVEVSVLAGPLDLVADEFAVAEHPQDSFGNLVLDARIPEDAVGAREAPGVDLFIAVEVVDRVRVLRGVELEVLAALRAGGEDRAVVRDPLDGVRVVIRVGLPDQVIVGVGVFAAPDLDDSGGTAGGADQRDPPPRLGLADLDVGQVRPPLLAGRGSSAC